MDVSARFGYFSGIALPPAAAMTASPLLLVPFREVRHDEPDDCLHYESVAVRGTEMDWTIPAHRHEGLHQFQFLAHGSVRGTIDGQDFEAQAPVMLLLAPGSVHGFTYTPDAVGHQVTLPTATLRQLLGGSNLVDDGLGTSCVLPRLEAAARDRPDLARLLLDVQPQYAKLRRRESMLAQVDAALESLAAMEASGGEPDVDDQLEAPPVPRRSG